MYAVQAESEFYHGRITQQQGFGALLGGDSDLQNKCGHFLVRDGSKKNQWVLVFVGDDAQFRESKIATDVEGELTLDGEDTGFSELLMMIQGLSSENSFTPSWSQVLRVPVAPLENKKEYKACEKTYKQYEKDIKLAIKAEKKLQRMSQKRKSRKGSTEVDTVMASPLSDTEPDEASDRRASMISQSSLEDPKEEWTAGSLVGMLKSPDERPFQPTVEPAAEPDAALNTNELFLRAQGYDVNPDRRVPDYPKYVAQDAEYDVSADGSNKLTHISVEQQRQMNAPKASNAFVDGVVRGTGAKSQFGLDSANLQADVTAQISQRVNEQARGAPGLVGAKTAVDATAAEIQRVKQVHQHAFGGNALRPPQDRVGGAMSRDKPADASWSGASLAPGQVHDVPDANGTLSWDGDQAVAPPMQGHVDDFSPFFFPNLHAKEDAEALLHLVGGDGSFLLRPHQSMGNTKYMLSVRYFGKVTHHLVYRTQPGASFFLCCLPYATTNEELREGRSVCTTLLQVLHHLMTPRQYWPGPLGAGVAMPVTEAEVHEMEERIREYKLEKQQERDNMAHQSKAGTKAKAPQVAQITFAKGGRRTSTDGSEDSTRPSAKRQASTEAMNLKKEEPKKTKSVPTVVEEEVTTHVPADYNYGAIGKKACEALLLAEPVEEGKFLLRSKADAEKNNFVLSVIYKGKVTHHMVNRDNSDAEFVVNKKIKSKANTVDGLVEALRKKQKGWPLELTTGIPKPDTGVDVKTTVQKTVMVDAPVDPPVQDPSDGGDNDVAADGASGVETPGSPKKSRKKGKGKNGAEVPEKIVKYTVTVNTSDLDNAGTTAQVSIELVGVDGRTTGKLHLKGARRNNTYPFDAGREYEMSFDLPDVGYIGSISLSHDNQPEARSMNPDWHVQQVEVGRFDDSAINGDARFSRSRFVINDWISESAGLVRAFQAENDAESKAQREAWQKNRSAELARLGNASKNSADVHVISRQKRVGSATGKPTAFDDSALAMRQQCDAAALAANTKRDPGIARGGLERNHMGASAHGIQLALNAPKVAKPIPQGTGAFSRDKPADAKFTDTEISSDDLLLGRSKDSSVHGDAVFR
eukprot:m.746119 g.746119  ORF g.746119 m.746119 type:complete len:1092 (+) comp23132_c0_seq1:303-3578(+)